MSHVVAKMRSTFWTPEQIFLATSLASLHAPLGVLRGHWQQRSWAVCIAWFSCFDRTHQLVMDRRTDGHPVKAFTVRCIGPCVVR